MYRLQIKREETLILLKYITKYIIVTKHTVKPINTAQPWSLKFCPLSRGKHTLFSDKTSMYEKNNYFR